MFIWTSVFLFKEKKTFLRRATSTRTRPTLAMAADELAVAATAKKPSSRSLSYHRLLPEPGPRSLADEVHRGRERIPPPLESAPRRAPPCQRRSETENPGGGILRKNNRKVHRHRHRRRFFRGSEEKVGAEIFAASIFFTSSRQKNDFCASSSSNGATRSERPLENLPPVSSRQKKTTELTVGSLTEVDKWKWSNLMRKKEEKMNRRRKNERCQTNILKSSSVDN